MPAPKVVLEPTGAWNLNYADDSCRLARFFGEGEQRTVLYLERYGPGDSFLMVVAGQPMRGSGRNEVTFQFGPEGGGEPRRRTVDVGDLGEYKPALVFTSTTLAPVEGIRENGDARRDFDQEEASAPPRGPTIQPAIEAGLSYLDIRRSGGKPIRFQLGPMGDPMQAMRNCTDELLMHWGIDVAAHSKLTRAAAPASNPGRWLTSRDYPGNLLAKGEQGIVKFRLSVDAEGKPSQCHIQQSTRPDGFDRAVCDKLMQRARFKPALGEDGEPLASYWRSTVRFRIPG
ncbi:energy transducer TonB [Parerythrobacter jejuensis]|nr:energy transducer TonB [Parerythrobacter jejuensis]